MKERRNRSIHALGFVALGLVLLLPGALLAQATGNIYVNAVSQDGGSLPGVTVTLTGIGAPRTQITNEQGTARFLGLDPGQYQVSAQLDSFGSVEYPGVSVAVGRNTSISLEMQPAIEDVITVTSESPLLDERRLSSGTQVSQVELEKIPSARDPWAMLSQTPGVMVDRINVGGSESGQQANFRASAVASTENDFMMDGISITDMSATGGSPGYYDFDQFAEMSFTTGGTDVTKNTSGVQVNLITKRGTNEFRGSARFYNEKAGGYFGGALKQSQPDVTSELNSANGQTSLAGAQIRSVEDIGFEAGGALLKDRIWLWGSWGQNDIKQNAASGDQDDTILENTTLKLNSQVNASNSLVASWNDGNKQKFGRGAGVTRPRPTTWNQRGPTAVYRVEDTHIFNSSTFVTGTWSHTDGGFQLLSIGQSGDGLAAGELNPKNIGGSWQDNFFSGSSSRPADEYKVDGSYFFSTDTVNHELKIGGRYREFEVNSDFRWGPNDTFETDWGTTVYFRGATGTATAEYTSLWAQDTMSIGRATINVGVRYDDQSGKNAPFVRDAHPTRPDLLPRLDFGGSSAGFSWETITPRLGVTYAIGKDRQTLLRASFAQFADQLQSAFITANSPLVYNYAYTYASTGELYNAVGFDPNNFGSTVNINDPNMDAPLTTELLLGAEHAFLPEFVVGVNLTARKAEDILDISSALPGSPVIGRYLVDDGSGPRVVTADDFEITQTISGVDQRTNRAYNVPLWDLRDGVDFTGGYFLTNGDRERDYLGASLNFTKRLANRWMARGYFSYGDSEWDVPVGSYYDAVDRNSYRGGGFNDGDLYLDRSAGSGKGERFLQSSWNYNLTGMYQVSPDRPWGFNISASIDGREGYPVPYYQLVTTGFGARNVDVTNELDDVRLDDVFIANLRVEKEFNLTGPVNMTFGIDMFNVTNENTGLAYNTRLGVANGGDLADNISPRIYRLGVRLSWK